MDYPNFDHYATLYAKYLQAARTQQLLDLCGPLKGRTVLDLCGGGGRAAIDALNRGASSVILVDESLPMSGHLKDTLGLQLKTMSVADYLAKETVPSIEAVVCQQAINYWFDPQLIKALASKMVPGAVFAFNSFWKCPGPIPEPKKYCRDGRAYVELSWLTEQGLIEHVQVCEGLPAHVTRFQWIPPLKFYEVLFPYFNVEGSREGATSIYRCTRKRDSMALAQSLDAFFGS